MRSNSSGAPEAFARYSFQNNVPFLAGNFGTVGMRLTYDLVDGGRKRAILGRVERGSLRRKRTSRA